MYNNILFYEKGKSTITLEINKSIGICLFLCDVLKILLKNYKSGDRSVQSWKKSVHSWKNSKFHHCREKF